MAFFFILFSNCQSSVGQTKNLMGFVNSSTMSTSRCADGIFFGTEQEKIYPVGSTQTTSGDSTLLSIDCMAVESEVASTMCQQSEMDC